MEYDETIPAISPPDGIYKVNSTNAMKIYGLHLEPGYYDIEVRDGVATIIKAPD